MARLTSKFMTMCAVIIGKCLTLGVNGCACEKLQRYKCNVHQNGIEIKNDYNFILRRKKICTYYHTVCVTPAHQHAHVSEEW